MKRLQKYISECGVCSRRKAEELILAGKVYVNGEKVSELGTKVSGGEEVIVDGTTIRREDKVYYLLNKPRGYISAVKDDKDRKTVVSLINTNKKIFPIGRLDYNTTGILLLTNDGELSNILTHPKSNVTKEYYAKIRGYFEKQDAVKLSRGIPIDGKMTKPAEFKLKRYDKKTDSSYVRVTLSEGRNHQVKEMFKYVGYDVLKLTRERYAFLDLGNLKSGEYRELSTKEVKQLYSLK